MPRIVIVGGYLFRFPLGGHVLSILHWLVGLRRLGFEVVFVEHYGWPYSCFDPQSRIWSDNPAPGLNVVTSLFERFGISRWCYVDVEGTYHGLPQEELRAMCSDAEVMLSLWTPTWVDEFYLCRRRIFIDTDPGFTQFSYDTTPRPGYASPTAFDLLFTYGTRIGEPDCPIPTHGRTWLPILPPVALDLVPRQASARVDAPFTTIMSWSTRKPIVFDGVCYGQKDIEFWKVADMPARMGGMFQLAITGESAPLDQLRQFGWRLQDGIKVTASIESYLDYIRASRAEFSVAVNLVVRSRCGWFSDRTAAYLASGRPAVVQDTGFSDTIRCGTGLLPFSTVADAQIALDEINQNYDRHALEARRLAEEFFNSDQVLRKVTLTQVV